MVDSHRLWRVEVRLSDNNVIKLPGAATPLEVLNQAIEKYGDELESVWVIGRTKDKCFLTLRTPMGFSETAALATFAQGEAMIHHHDMLLDYEGDNA